MWVVLRVPCPGIGSGSDRPPGGRSRVSSRSLVAKDRREWRRLSLLSPRNDGAWGLASYRELGIIEIRGCVGDPEARSPPGRPPRRSGRHRDVDPMGRETLAL